MKTYLVAMVSAAALLTGCASAPSMSYGEKNQAYVSYITDNKLASLKKINTFRMYGWQSLTNDYLIISTSPKKKFLVEVNGFCPDLAHAQTIAFNQSMSSSLSTRFDSISVLGGNVGDHMSKCYIQAIHQIDKAQAKEISAIGKPIEKEQG